MRGQSRYTNRYSEFQRARDPIPLNQAGVLEIDSYLVNIANGQCGDVKVSCWPTREGVEGGRAWGKLNATSIAIVPFRARAGTTSSTVKVGAFELELFFCEPDWQGLGPAVFPDCYQQKNCVHSAIDLVESPAPVCVTGRTTSTGSEDTTIEKPWELRSEAIESCDGKSRAAKWKWVANGHEPVVSYGGVALQHMEEPFVVACRVRGKAFVELFHQSVPIRIRYQFSNEERPPKWWTMIPQQSSEDLSQDVAQLEAVMQNLNTISHEYHSHSLRAFRGTGRSQGHNFGPAMIGGSASVVMGDLHLYNPGSSQHNAGL